MPILLGVKKPLADKPRQISIRARREKLGLSQEALAARCGLEQTSISKLELGVVSEPLFSTGLKIADALELDPHELKFGGGAAA